MEITLLIFDAVGTLHREICWKICLFLPRRPIAIWQQYYLIIADKQLNAGKGKLHLKSRRKSGDGMKGMVGMQGIRVGMRGIRVGMRGNGGWNAGNQGENDGNQGRNAGKQSGNAGKNWNE